MIIALDTEFMRDRTYHPMLSIVQIKINNKTEIFDILLDSENKLNFLIEILKNDNIIKIIHACKQDIQAIYHRFDIIINNIFDTQIAAKFMGLGNEISYRNLVKEFCDIEIIKDKNLQYSRWDKRPLTKEQIEYAKQDVEFLHAIYEKMMLYFISNQTVFELFKNNCAQVSNKNLYDFNPTNSWDKKAFTKSFGISYHQKTKLKKLFILREIIANKRNIPKDRIIKNQDLLNLVKSNEYDRDVILEKLPKFIDKKELLKILDESLTINHKD
jgi:ribonuclease D